MADFLIRDDKTAELQDFVRDSIFEGPKDQKVLHQALKFFQDRKHDRAAWEVLLKLKDRKLMLKHAVQHQNFADALKMLKESRADLDSPELSLPLASFLVFKGRFDEALRLFARARKPSHFHQTLRQYIQAEFSKHNYPKVIAALRYAYKLSKKPLHLKLVRFFLTLESVDTQCRKLHTFGSLLENRSSWEVQLEKYWTSPLLSLDQTSLSRLDVLQSQISTLVNQSFVRNNSNFREIFLKLENYARKISKVRSQFSCKNLKNLKSINSKTQSGGKENRERNALGSKSMFKKLSNKLNNRPNVVCHLCHTRQRPGGPDRCGFCKIQIRKCQVTGTVLPLVVFKVESNQGGSNILNKNQYK